MSEGIVTLGTPSGALGLGDPNEHMTGTKTSGPRGVESVLEYNQIYLNVREWIDTYIVSVINGIDDADVRDSRDPNPGAHGETPGQSYYGGRTIVLQGKVVARTIWKLRDLQQALRGAFADLSQEYPLYFRTNDVDTDMLIWCKKSGSIQMADEQTTPNGFERPFQITLRASNPRFLSYKEELKTANLAVGGNAIQVVNNGNFEAEPVIRIDGPISADVAGGIAFSLSNGANNQVINLKALPGATVCIAAGRYLLIDIHKKTLGEYVSATDAYVGSGFPKFDVSSDWMVFLAGVNMLSAFVHQAPGGVPTISIRHRHSYL